IRTPTSKGTSTTGNSHHFLFCMRKEKRSFQKPGFFCNGESVFIASSSLKLKTARNTGSNFFRSSSGSERIVYRRASAAADRYQAFAISPRSARTPERTRKIAQFCSQSDQ